MTVILGVDTETNGDSQEARQVEGKTEEERAEAKTEVLSEIVELGLSLFHVERRTVLASYSAVFKVKKWGAEAAIIHGIPQDISDFMPPDPPFDPWDIIQGDMVDYVVAHNAEHDHPLVTTRWKSFLKRPWLCTRQDVKHIEATGPDGHKILHRAVGSTRLGHLCVDYGIALNGWHRALADAEACARIAACHDLKAALAYKNEPKYKLLAFGKFIENTKEMLQDAPSVKAGGKRYQWEPDKKSWTKEGLTEGQVLEDGAYIKQVTSNRWNFKLEPMPPKSY